MDREEYKQLLKSTIIDVLSEMAFIQVEEVESDIPLSSAYDKVDNPLYAYIKVKSHCSLFILISSKTIIEEVARNIFALDFDEVIEENLLNDTLAEMLNTISGKFMKEITPEDQIYELGLPVIGKYENTNCLCDHMINFLFETLDGNKIFILYGCVNEK